MKVLINLLSLRRNFKSLLLITCLTYFSQSINAQQLAFPSAYGAGAYTTGGRGGAVVHVTNLNADGVGSLKWALEAEENQVPRTIVFDVSGVIELNGRLRMSNDDGDPNRYSDNVTIAGQSAPEGGITIIGGKIQMEQIDNVIWRYVKFHDTNNQDGCLTSSQSNNVIFDHLSGSHTNDIVFSVVSTNQNVGTGNKTIQNCLFAQAKNGLIIGDTTPEGGSEGDISVLRNAYYSVGWRVPFKGGNDVKVDAINNLAHNWSARLIRMDAYDYTLNHIGNYYQSGINSSNTLLHCSWVNGTANPEIYNFDNFLSPNKQPDGYENDESVAWTEFQNNFALMPSDWFVNQAHALKGRPIPILPSSELKDAILPLVGASQYLTDQGTVGFYRDIYDTAHVAGILNDDNLDKDRDINANEVQSISNTRPANFYVNNPHIPEVWFAANVPAGEDHNDIAPNGYTWLENYLNQVDGEVVAIGAESVAVAPNSATLNIPETITLTRTFTPANTTNQSGTWTTSDASVATVSQNGLVTSVGEGTAAITFTSTDGGFSDSANITVTNIIIDLQSLTVNPNTLALEIGDNFQASVDFLPINATNQDGTWTIDNPAIASVDENGNIIGISEGTTTVTFTASDTTNGTLSDTIDITVTVPLPLAAPIISSVTRSGNDYVVTFSQPPNTAIPEGGYNTYITSADTGGVRQNQGDFNTLAGQFTRTYTGLNNNIDQTFEIDARYFQFDPPEFRMSDPVTFFFDTALVANAGIDQSICEGETTTLIATGGTNFLWSTGETTASIEVNPTETTTYSVTVSNDQGEQDTDEVIVTVNTAPIADAGEDQTICEGETLTLVATGGTAYLWNTGETTPSIEVNPAAETIYEVEVTSGNCSTTDSVTVFVVSAPNLTVSNDSVIQQGQSTILVANGADNYLWNTGETTASVTVTPTVTTIYTVSSIGANNCSISQEVTVTVVPEVVADAGTDTAICVGESVVLNATGGGTYLWNTGETTSELIVSPLVTTIYTVTVEDEFGFTDTDSVTITVNETPDITVNDDVVIIDGESTTLSATGGDNYQWSTGETTATITVTPITTTTYTVISTAVGGCADIEQVTVTVIPEVVADAGEDATICSGSSITLNATGGGTYLWNTGDVTAELIVSPLITTTYSVTVEDDFGFTDTDSVTITVNETPNISVSNDITIMDSETTTLTATGGNNYLWNTGATSASIIVSPNATTTYTVSSFGEGDCQDTEEVTVTVIPEVVADAGSDASICNGDSITLNASGGTSYSWNTGDTGSQLTVSPTVTTTYTVTVEDNFGNSDADSVTITVNETPNISVSNDVTIMDGESATLTANGGDNYQWSTGATTASITVSPNETTTYTVSSFGEGNCEVTEEVTVTVIPELVANAGADASICNGDSITLNASGGILYTWDTGDTGSQLTVSPTVTTTYTVTVEDNLGNSDADSVTITVNETPNISVSNDVTIMDGESATLTANGGDNYQWNTGATTASITVSPNVTTTYTVSSLGEGNCEDTEEVTVTVIPELVANAGADASICNGDSITLNASGGILYTWDTGDTGSQLTVSPAVTTTYTVTVEDNFGNSDTDEVTITVNEMPNVVISENITIVEGESTDLVVNGAETYLWSTGESSNTITVSPTLTTTYTVIATSNSCSLQAQVTVTVEGIFQVSAGLDARVCEDDTYEVILTASQGDSYLWNTGETTQSITVSPLTTSTYSVTVTQGIQEDTDEVTVYVDPNPDVVILNGDSVDIMNGDFVTLSASGANSYEWNNGATQPNIAVSPSVTTTYEVRGYVGDCFDEKQITVNVIPEVIADAGEDVTICLDEVVTLNATGGDEYVWSTGETTQSIQVSPSVTTEYTVTVFNALDFDEDSVIVEVDTDCDEETPEEPVDGDVQDFDFEIFPNPASGILNVKLSGSDILTNVYLYDLTGKLIDQIRISNEDMNNSSTTQIDVSQLQSGIYYVKLVDIHRDISKKLIVN